MMPSNNPSIGSATHVAFDMATVERLSRLGAANVVRASDRLVIGPSRLEPMEHTRARDAFLGSPLGEWDHLYSPGVRWQPPVVLWVSASIHERVNLWRALHWLRNLGLASGDVLLLEFEDPTPSGPPEEPLPPFDCTVSVAHHADHVLLERVGAARPWRRSRYNRGANLWEKYVNPDPLPLVQSCLRGVPGFPELGPLWMLLSAFFPRRTLQGELRVSRFDDLLLRILTAEPQTSVRVFAHDSRLGMDLRQLVSCTGDLFLEDRLARWAWHGRSPAVERTASPRPGSPLLSHAYRITAHGRELREKGLDDLTDAPPLPIAGAEAYAPSAPWVLLEDGRLDRL